MRRLKVFMDDFVAMESAGGIVLMVFLMIAMLWANLGHESYEALLHTQVALTFGAVDLSMTLHHFVNDFLMAIFFLLVGCEIKREVLDGELSSREQIVMPFTLALMGFVVPAVIYVLVTRGDPSASAGWAIPTATDIAFALGALMLLGSRVPLALKVMLMALAIIDDLAAMVVIAVFYTAQINLMYAVYAALLTLLMLAMGRMRVANLTMYLIMGVVLWYFMYKSGIHATLAGVITAFTIPYADIKGEGSMIKKMEHELHEVVAFGIVPIFCLFNAGIYFVGMDASSLSSSVTMGVFLGLFLGKPIGILMGAALMVNLGMARLPEGVNRYHMVGMAMFCGVGFTMALFVGGLSGVAGDGYKVAILGASVLSIAGGLFFVNKGTVIERAARGVMISQPA